ncbi:MAG: crotonase/enoyl-CoA hydratase family protein [Nitrosospira sp.]
MNGVECIATELSWIDRPYKYLQLEWDPVLSLLRMKTKVRPIQCYSLALMAEMHQVLTDISISKGCIKHLVMTSDMPGVFNFGGDLSLFVLLIRARDLDSLQMYGYRCIELIWWMETASQRGVHTVVLVQGDALGGGLESVLPYHKVIFERSAQGGYPEVLFNLFPGMGAWNFTIRKAGFAVANEMILSGRIYTAEELLCRKVVDIVVDDGEGAAAVQQLVRSVHPRLRGVLTALEARRAAAAITYKSLEEIVNQWAATAMTLTDRDLKLMERLARAQIRKIGGLGDGAVEELKKLELSIAWERDHVTPWISI